MRALRISTELLLGLLLLAARVAEPAAAQSQPEPWAFREPIRSEPPEVSDPTWAHTVIDRFVLAKLDAAGLRPMPLAGRVTLIRRLSFDLTGLPPTPADVDAFVRDESPDAYERLIDRFLASSAYGERWAQHWLDIA